MLSELVLIKSPVVSILKLLLTPVKLVQLKTIKDFGANSLGIFKTTLPFVLL